MAGGVEEIKAIGCFRVPESDNYSPHCRMSLGQPWLNDDQKCISNSRVDLSGYTCSDESIAILTSRRSVCQPSPVGT